MMMSSHPHAQHITINLAAGMSLLEVKAGGLNILVGLKSFSQTFARVGFLRVYNVTLAPASVVRGRWPPSG